MRIFAIVIVCLLTAGFFLLVSPLRRHAPQKLTIAIATENSAPLCVALREGLFDSEGLDVTLLPFDSGKAALEALLQGRADLATAADTVLMFAGMNGEDVLDIATLSQATDQHAVVALRDRGIAAARDLAGKRIGVMKGTSSEFFLYTFLLFRGIPRSAVRFVELPPDAMAGALSAGRVDAVAVWHPIADGLKKKFGADAVLFQDGTYIQTWNLLAGAPFVRAEPAVITKLLRALLRSERFIASHPGRAIADTAGFLPFDPAGLRDGWSNYSFSAVLEENLIINLEDQARWARQTYYPHARRIPDFTRLMYTRGLRGLDPAAVSIRSGAP